MYNKITVCLRRPLYFHQIFDFIKYMLKHAMRLELTWTAIISNSLIKENWPNTSAIL